MLNANKGWRKIYNPSLYFDIRKQKIFMLHLLIMTLATSKSSKKTVCKKVPMMKKHQHSVKKAPGAPKRFRSSFILFYMNFHKSMRETTFTDGGKMHVSTQCLRRSWRSLPSLTVRNHMCVASVYKSDTGRWTEISFMSLWRPTSYYKYDNATRSQNENSHPESK